MSTDNGCRPHNLINCSRCMAERERLAREARISELEARVEELTARLADMRRSKVYWRTAALRERELTRRQQRADSREHEFHAQRDVFRDLLSRWLEAFDARLFAGPLIASTKRALAPVEEAAPQRDHARHDWQCIFCGDWSAVPYRMCCAEGRRADMSVQENVKSPCALCGDPEPPDGHDLPRDPEQ